MKPNHSVEAPSTEAPHLVNDVKAAEILGLALGTLRYWRTQKKGPRWIKMEGAIRYDVADLRAYIDSNRSTPGITRA